MLALARDPQLRATFGARNRDRAPAAFSIDAAVERVNSAYARLLRRVGRRGAGPVTSPG
jgi:hypothetical protein